MVSQLTTADEVIDALGGTGATAKLTGRKYDQAVSNWRATNKLPADTFLIITTALEQLGKTAPASLWGMATPENSDEETEPRIARGA